MYLKVSVRLDVNSWIFFSFRSSVVYDLLLYSNCNLPYEHDRRIERAVDIVGHRFECTTEHFEWKYQKSRGSCCLQETVIWFHSISLGREKVLYFRKTHYRFKFKRENCFRLTHAVSNLYKFIITFTLLWGISTICSTLLVVHIQLVNRLMQKNHK